MNTHEHSDHEPTADAVASRGAQHYQITVHGHLGPRWSTWFDGLDLVRNDDGTTVITGPVVDQSALHGLLQRLRDLGIPLISLTPATPDHDTPQSERP